MLKLPPLALPIHRAVASSPPPSQGNIHPPCIGLFDRFVVAVTLASLFKGHQPRSPVPPPSSFPSGFKPVTASSTNNRLGLPDSQGQQQRRSRTDLDFEEALASPDTIVLREGIDLFSPELEASISLTPPPCRPSLYGNSLGASGNGSPNPNPKGRNTAAPLKQPGTPTVIPATPTPPRNNPLHVLTPTTSSSSNSTPFHTPLASPEPSCDGEDGTSPTTAQPSTQTPNPNHFEGFHPLPYDVEEKEHQFRQRSMYRSPGSASSPDLVTLLKKTKQRNGSSNAGPSGTGSRDHLRPDTSEVGNGGRLRTTSATPSSASSNSIPHQGQRPRIDRIATNGSSSSYRRGDDSNFLNARSPDWVLPSPSSSPAPSPSVLKVHPTSCINQIPRISR